MLPGLRYLRNGDRAELAGGVVVAGVGGCHGPSSFERPANTLQGSARRHYTRDELDHLAARPRPDVRCVGLNAVGRPGHLVAFALEAGGSPVFLAEWPSSWGRTA